MQNILKFQPELSFEALNDAIFVLLIKHFFIGHLPFFLLYF